MYKGMFQDVGRESDSGSFDIPKFRSEIYLLAMADTSVDISVLKIVSDVLPF